MSEKKIIKKLKEDIKFRQQFGMIAEIEINIINGLIDEAFKELKKERKNDS